MSLTKKQRALLECLKDEPKSEFRLVDEAGYVQPGHGYNALRKLMRLGLVVKDHSNGLLRRAEATIGTPP